MNIFIVGLGLIGASYASGLSKKEHRVYGYDQSEKVMQQAIEQEIIEPSSSLEKMKEADLIILALYPKENVQFIKKHHHLLVFGQVLTDVSGTKSNMMKGIHNHLPKGVSYTSHHPMAGKESSGFSNHSSTLFDGANLIIVKGERSLPKDESLIHHIAKDLNFGKIIVTDALTHDRLVAFTSQLTHILAVCLMHADHDKETQSATGDSFRDLTRIAKINEIMWSELFMENKDLLLIIMDNFEQEFKKVKEMIALGDHKALSTYLRQAREKRDSFDIH